MIKQFVMISAIGMATLLSGCNKMPGQHRVDVRQGNYLDERRVEQLQIGMTKNDVRLLIGSTLVNDPYRPEIWHYVYSHQDADGRTKDYKRLVLTFTNQLLSNIEHTPSTNPVPDRMQTEAPINSAPETSETSDATVEAQ